MAAKVIRKCPICGKPTDAALACYPFCSDRCRMIDLGNWASEKYVVHRPLTEAEQEETPRAPQEEEP